MRNRRRSARLPVGFYVDQIVGDDPHRCFTTDLSAIGLYMERLVEPLRRSSKIVQLEIPLPANLGLDLGQGRDRLRPLRRAVSRHGRALHRHGPRPSTHAARVAARGRAPRSRPRASIATAGLRAPPERTRLRVTNRSRPRPSAGETNHASRHLGARHRVRRARDPGPALRESRPRRVPSGLGAGLLYSRAWPGSRPLPARDPGAARHVRLTFAGWRRLRGRARRRVVRTDHAAPVQPALGLELVRPAADSRPALAVVTRPSGDVLEVSLWIDAGARDADPPQVATLADLGRDTTRRPGAAGHAWPDTIELSATCHKRDLPNCWLGFARALRRARPDACCDARASSAWSKRAGRTWRAIPRAPRTRSRCARCYGDGAAGLLPLGRAQDDGRRQAGSGASVSRAALRHAPRVARGRGRHRHGHAGAAAASAFAHAPAGEGRTR